jgi:hypothetical protein
VFDESLLIVDGLRSLNGKPTRLSIRKGDSDRGDANAIALDEGSVAGVAEVVIGEGNGDRQRGAPSTQNS